MEKNERAARPTACSLFEAIWLDIPANLPASTDFGIETQEHYNAIYYAVRNGDLSLERLDAALGDGKKITALVNSVEGCNPERLKFYTFWDELYGRNVPQLERNEAVEPKKTQQKHRQQDHERER